MPISLLLTLAAIVLVVAGLLISRSRPVDRSASPSTSRGATASPTEPTARPSPDKLTPTPTKTDAAGRGQGAFPGALGYGRTTMGGRGGRIVYVSSLEDEGPGTLREALESDGPRTVLFAVAGTIDLRSNIDVTDPFVTIAGQSAPGDGVQIRGAMIRVLADDVVIRYLRLRPGDEPSRENPADVDALTIHGANEPVRHVIVDHSTLVWGPDIGGIAILGDVRDVTVQDSILGEGLYLSHHPEGRSGGGGHSMGTNVTQLDSDVDPARGVTFVHNLFTTSNERMPRFQGTECADVINNVIYNWGARAGHGNPRSLNVVGNVFRAGPQTVGHRFWVAQHSDVSPDLFLGSVWESDNVADGFEVGGDAGDERVFADAPVCPLSVEPTEDVDPNELLEVGLDGVGASLPIRDPVDERIVANVAELRGSFLNGEGRPPPNPDWPDLAPARPAADVDADGMPDDWEQRAFGSLDRGDPADSSGDADGDGWTDVEEYLNGTDPTTAG